MYSVGTVLATSYSAYPQHQGVSFMGESGRAWQASARFHVLVGGLQCRNPGNQNPRGPWAEEDPHGRKEKTGQGRAGQGLSSSPTRYIYPQARQARLYYGL